MGSGGLFIVSIYLTDILNNRLMLYIGSIVIAILGFIVQRKKIKPLTFGFWIGCIPILIIIIGFIIVSSIH